jgi:hypothetical protein
MVALEVVAGGLVLSALCGALLWFAVQLPRPAPMQEMSGRGSPPTPPYGVWDDARSRLMGVAGFLLAVGILILLWGLFA